MANAAMKQVSERVIRRLTRFTIFSNVSSLVYFLQCLRPRAMQIAAPCSVEQLCQFAQDHQVVWVGTEGAPPLHTIAAETLEKLEKLEKNEATSGAVSLPHKGLLIIGPEGDFTVEELQMMATVGRAVVVGLGNNRLRSETAAISMLSFATLTLS